MNKKVYKKGFTLIELVVVIGILAILGGVSVATYVTVTENARKSADEQLCRQYNDILAIEKIYDSDISLVEFMNAVSNNGLEVNNFETSSKNYSFAYDKSGATCVLLDKASGEIRYPQGYISDKTNLWKVLNDDLAFQTGVSNYQYLNGSLLVDKAFSGNNTETYTIDLNNSAFKIESEDYLANVYSLNLTNGVYFYDSEIPEKIKGDVTKMKENDTSSTARFITENKDNYNIFDLNGTVKSYYGAMREEGNDELVWAIKAGTTGTEYNIDGYTFSGVSLVIETDKPVKITNCNFINVPKGSVPLTVKGSNNIEISGNTFESDVKGLSVSVPNKDKTVLIKNNSFDLTKKRDKNSEINSNCIELLEIYNSESLDIGTINIENNKVYSALGFVSIDAGIGEHDLTANDEATKYKNLLSVTFKNNVTSGAEKMVAIDTDYKHLDMPAGSYTRDEWKVALETVARKIYPNYN